MADLRKTYGTNKSKELDGVWEDIGDGIRVKVARIGNSKYQKTFNRISKPHRKALRRGTLKEDIAEKLMIDCMVDAVLLDWENVELDGQVIPYSKENATKILTEFKDFRDTINDYANDMAIFMEEDAEELEDQLKNS